MVGTVRADRSHTVAAGQSLAAIARKYDVTVWSLAAANAITPETPVRTGQVLNVPDKGVVYVNAGQTLWSVARRHECTVEALASANGLTTASNLRPGMRLVLPGHKPSPGGVKEPREAGGRSWGTPKKRGHVTLYRVATQQNLALTLVDKRGRVTPNATQQLSRFLRPRNSKKTKKPQARLLALLAQVSDHFGGRKIHVISGYRMAGGRTNEESRHVAAAAIDMRVEGVPNRILRDYLRHFDDVGVGYYPNSTFIHFDVRSKNAYWVDLSSPGQKAAYVPRDEREGFEGKTTGLADLAKSLESTIEDIDPHGEPDEVQADDE
ncbi:MAG: LysM peptidoglycan-binding domain-containing protein [Myxococcales bacterium]